MKKVLFTFIFLIVAVCSAQEYDPILKDGAYWDRKQTQFSTFGSCSNYDRTQIAGDTIINNVTYKKLVNASLYDQYGEKNCIQGPLFIDDRDFRTVTHYFLREDINTKQLFILDNNDPSNAQEFLLCDFNLEIGDQLINFYGQANSDPLTIVDVITNSNNKKEYTVSDGSTYIEGLGKTYGNDIPYNYTIDFVEFEVTCNGDDNNPVSCATEYQSVLKEGSFWDVSTTGPGVCVYKNKYRVGDNFIHNGLTYKRIEYAPIRDVNFPNDLCLTGSDLFVNENDFQESQNTFIRENLLEKRVYILFKDDDNNYLEFTSADFSLQLGEQMENAFTYTNGSASADGEDLTVAQIDVLVDGRKKFTVENGESYEEGIGSNQGPLQIYRPFELYNDVNTVSCYGNDNFLSGSCVQVLSTNGYETIDVTIYPNPTSGTLKISGNKNYHFRLYSILGKQVQIQSSEEDQQLDISHLASGIYFLRIQVQNKSDKVLKIIKD